MVPVEPSHRTRTRLRLLLRWRGRGRKGEGRWEREGDLGLAKKGVRCMLVRGKGLSGHQTRGLLDEEALAPGSLRRGGGAKGKRDQ